MSRDTQGRQPFAWRLQYVLPAGIGIAGVVILALQLGGGPANPAPRQPSSTPSSAPTAAPTAAVPTSTVLGSGPGGSPDPTSSPPSGAVVLGRDLKPIDQAQCRSPD